MSSSLKGWECSFPSCGKRFTRKEHLNRHNLTHNTEHQYKCHVCGRRYVRSDVFRRHLKQHNIDAPETRFKREAVKPERNTRCDRNSPCGACILNWTDCRWDGSGNGHGAAVDPEQPATILPVTPSPSVWLPSNPGAWASQPFPSTHLYSLAPNDLNNGHQPQGSAGPVDNIFSGSNVSTGRSEPVLNDSSDGPEGISQPATPFVSTPSQQQTTHDFPELSGITESRYGFDRTSAETRRLVELFFSDIYPYWAVLHAPTFDIEKAPTILLASMIMLASWLEYGPQHQKLASVVFEELNRIRMDLNPPLYLLQTMLFYVIYATYTLTIEGTVARVLNLSGVLISTCRYLGIFNGQYISQSDQDCECPFVVWRAQEQLNRLAFSILRVDTYLSVLLDNPPSVRHQELCIPLPKSRRLWASLNNDERRRLQWNEPAGREKALFSFLMRDALNPANSSHVGKLPYQLTDIDYHLTTCATQPSLWEAAREAHSSMSDELVNEINPHTFVQLAHTHLTLWGEKCRQDCEAVKQYLVGSLRGEEHLLLPHTLTLVHVSTLKLHTPFNTLRVKGHYYKCRPGASIPTRKPGAHLRSWVASGCPRSALWNAARLCSVYSIELAGLNSVAPASASAFSSPSATANANATSTFSRAHLRLNPLLLPSVFMSAIVACSFARHTRTCEECCGPGSGSGAPINLFDAADDDPALDAWRLHGVGVPYWGSGSGAGDRIPVCKCRLPDIAAWFREAFAGDPAAEMEFVLFLAEMSAETQAGC
ncbi:hypothetical protein GGR54DRAFT_631560 [Hypoxylon sp. NC1633]|nr:hypothetical protein GGR54DRAFT_631560 [Hypoxylon sp. NC1633]